MIGMRGFGERSRCRELGYDVYVVGVAVGLRSDLYLLLVALLLLLRLCNMVERDVDVAGTPVLTSAFRH